MTSSPARFLCRKRAGSTPHTSEGERQGRQTPAVVQQIHQHRDVLNIQFQSRKLVQRFRLQVTREPELPATLLEDEVAES